MVASKKSDSVLPQYANLPNQLPIMVHVTAPSTLEGGYIFDATINDDPNKVFKCKVPEGGVVAGQVFLVPLPEDYDGPRINAPTGRWKDGLCDCCSVGLFHPSLWCSLCCDIIAIGQLMTRMQLTAEGRPGPLSRTKNAFTVIILMFISFIFFVPFYYYLKIKSIIQAGTSGDQTGVHWYYELVVFVLLLWYIITLCRTRKSIRERYQIPEQRCKGCEDCCCAYWCACCTISQMLRHTGEYEYYNGVCCSKTGHPPGTPLVI